MARRGLADWLEQYGLLDQGEAIVRDSGTDIEKAERLTQLLVSAGAKDLKVSYTQVFRWRQALGVAPPQRESNKREIPRAKPEPKRKGAPPGNRNAVGHGPPEGNQNALVTGEYARLWEPGLTPEEFNALHQVGEFTTLEQINRQLGLIDVRIGRMMLLVRQTRAALAAGVELQLESRTESDKLKTRDDGELITAGPDTVTATNVLVHTREVLERQEAALDRMLQRREKLLALRVSIDLKKQPDGGGGEGEHADEYRAKVREILQNQEARGAVRDIMRQVLRARAGL